MTKIKRFLNCIVPVTVCNLKCHYCYIGQTNAFSKDMPKLEYSVEHMLKCLTPNRLGGVCMMNLCATGETLIAPYLFDLVKGFLEQGHYVTIVTNGVLTEKIKEYCDLSSDEKSRLFFKFSYHYLQLKKLNIIDKFFQNVNLVKNAGISFSIELTVNDESIPYIDELNDACIKNLGASPHIIESRDNNNGFKRLTKLNEDEHLKAWSKIDTPLIKFQSTIWGEHRDEFCYAGMWITNLFLATGELTPCFGGGPVIQNIFEDESEPIHWCPIGNKCPWEHCFAAHALLTFGAIPSLDTPYYDEIRNRETSAGEWLQPRMKEFMHSKYIESNNDLSQNQKNIINWYRSIKFGELYDKATFKNSLEELFKEKNINSIAVVHDDTYSSSFIENISNGKVKIKYILVDPNCEKESGIKNVIKRKTKYTIKRVANKEKPLVLSIYDSRPKVDAIVVLDIFEYLKLKAQKFNNVILITDLATEDI